MLSRRSGLGFAAVLCAMLGASSASAVSFYGELLTPVGGARGTLTTDFGYGIDLVGGEWLPGLPNGGLVTGYAPLTYTHHFAPDLAVASILSASLYVELIDDAAPFTDLLNPNERAVIKVDDSLWRTGYAVLHLHSGAVALNAFLEDGRFTVTVGSANGTDFRVVGSLFKVKFEPAVAPIPEPSAIAVFAAGLLLAGAALRRRSAAR